jgi:two-component system, OmpR family, response regulator VanR
MAEDKKTILIAEDEEDLREMYTQALSSHGFEVLQAVNGEEAVEWLERRYSDIDMILLDIVMPVMDGLETLKKIKKDDRFKKIRIVVFTNLNNDEDKQQALGLGANDYFVKSQHTPAELIEKIKLIFSE